MSCVVGGATGVSLFSKEAEARLMGIERRLYPRASYYDITEEFEESLHMMDANPFFSKIPRLHELIITRKRLPFNTAILLIAKPFKHDYSYSETSDNSSR